MTGAFYYGETYEDDGMCGDGLTIFKTDPPMEGVSICTQKPDHRGLHVGAISWANAALDEGDRE